MGYSNVYSSLFIIFALAVPGIIFRRLGMADYRQLKTMSSFMMKIILPAVIIYSMQQDFSQEILSGGIKVFGAVFLLFVLVLAFSAVFTSCIGFDRKYAGLVAFILFFANTGGIGIPVMNMLFGPEAVFYASAVEMAVDILIFTAGTIIMQFSGNSEKMGIDFKSLISPGMFSIAAGLFLFFTGIKLPGAVNGVLEKLSDASLAVTMFVIGGQIGGINFKLLKNKGRLMLIAAAKLCIVPMAMYFVSSYVFNCGQLASAVLTALFAMPTGGAAAIFAQEYGADAELASASVFLTDVLCIATLPLLILFLR